MDPSDLEDDEEGMTYAEMVKRDQRRWQLADQDDDEALTIEEFTDFLHPEEAEHMQSIVVTETMEDIDKDKDGKISLEEYIGKSDRIALISQEVPVSILLISVRFICRINRVYS